MSPVYTNDHPKEYITKDASFIRELLNAEVFSGLGMSLAEAVVEPSGKTIPHSHANCDEIYYCLEGEGALFINGEAFPFSPHRYYLLPRNSVHSLAAETRLRLLCICCPGYAHEDTRLFACK